MYPYAITWLLNCVADNRLQPTRQVFHLHVSLSVLYFTLHIVLTYICGGSNKLFSHTMVFGISEPR